MDGWLQGYNAQAATNEPQIVLAAEVMVSSPDFGHLEPMFAATGRERKAAGVSEVPEVLLADAGYWHHEQMQRIMAQVLVSLARDTYLEALTAVFFPGRLASTEIVLETARAARAAPPWSQSPRAPDLLLDGLALLITDGYAAGTPILSRAIDGFRDEETSRGDGRRWLWLASRVAAFLWDDENWDMLSARFVELARDAGALSVLPVALATRSVVPLFAGELVSRA